MVECRLCGSEELMEYFVDGDDVVYQCILCEFVQRPIIENVHYLDDTAAEDTVLQDKCRKTSERDLNSNSNGPLRNVEHLLKQDSIRISSFVSDILENFYSTSSELKLIDVGSGYGHNSFKIKKDNPDLGVHLLEISKDRMDLGIEVYKPDLTEFTFHHKLLDDSFVRDNSEMFDIVVNIHVLEHVYDMVDFLKRLYSITNEGGFLIVEVPNEDDDLFQYTNNYEGLVKIPSHVSFFTKDTLTHLVEVAGINNANIGFVAIQRYGFFNYMDWLRYDDKSMVASDDYVPRDRPIMYERGWLQLKKEKFLTDTIQMIIRK